MVELKTITKENLEEVLNLTKQAADHGNKNQKGVLK